MLFSLIRHIAANAWLMNIVRSLFLFSNKEDFVHSLNVESNMYQIIFIHFVLIITFCETLQVKRKPCLFNMDNWKRNLFSGFCGTDGISYRDKNIFKCMQESEYGQRVNLQLSHNGACFTWPLLWRTIAPFLLVSRTDLILIENQLNFCSNLIAARAVYLYLHWRVLVHLSDYTEKHSVV